MRALIFKELAGSSVFLLTGAFCVGAAILDGGAWGAWSMWVLPKLPEADILMGIALIGGFLLGFTTFFGETVHGTLEYIAHRPVSLTRIVAAKFIACAVVSLGWLMAPLVLQLLLFGLWDPGLHFYEFGRIGIYLSLWTLSLSACAAGCLVGTLRAHPLFRLGMAGVLLLALLSMSWLLMSSGGRTSPALFALLHLFVAGVLCTTSWWTLREGADPDLPASPHRTGLSASILAIAVVLAGGLGIATLQNESVYGLYRTYPSLAKTGDDRVVLRRWLRDQGTVLFDARHRPIPDSQDAAAGARAAWGPWELLREDEPFWQWRSWGRDYTGFFRDHEALRASLSHMQDARFLSGDLYHDRGPGLVRAYWRGDPTTGVEPRVLELGRGSERLPFRGELLSQRVSEHEIVLVDLGDRSLWRLDEKALESGFVQVGLPDGDVFAEPVDMPSHARVELAAFEWLNEHNLEFVIRGERGFYVWHDGRFEPTPEPMTAMARTRTSQRSDTLPVRVLDGDLVAPVVELLHEDGRVLGSHSYGLYRLEEKAYGAALYASSLLRAPVLQLLSFSRSPDDNSFRTSLERGTADLLDPLLAHRHRPLLLLLNLLLGAGCGWFAMRRLRRLGAPPGRRVFWAALLFTGGPLVLLVHYALERRRAWRATPVEAENTGPGMLLRTG